MKNGFVIDGLTPRTLAEKLVEVGEAHLVFMELGNLIGKGEFNKESQLEIKIDASAVQEAIDKEMKSLGVLGEVARYPLIPRNASIVVRIDEAQQTVMHAYHERNNPTSQYRDALLRLAALSVSAIELLDQEQTHVQSR